MRRLGFARIGERMRGGDHLEFAVPLEFAHQTIDQLRIDHRLVALNVNDVRELLRFRRDFRDAIGSARMIRRRQGDFRAPIERRLSDAEVVRRDDQVIQFLRAPASFPDVLEQRLARDEMERFAGETRRSPTRRDDAKGFAHNRRVDEVMDA